MYLCLCLHPTRLLRVMIGGISPGKCCGKFSSFFFIIKRHTDSKWYTGLVFSQSCCLYGKVLQIPYVTQTHSVSSNLRLFQCMFGL